MGKGDKKSKKGKRFKHSYGKTRTRKKGRTISSRKKVEVKTRPVEHKKTTKPEPEMVKPVVVIEPKVEEIVIKAPEVSVIQEDIKPPEIREEVITKIPEVTAEPVMEKPKIEEPVKETPKAEPAAEEKPAKEAPRKRGRPKKKKEE